MGQEKAQYQTFEIQKDSQLSTLVHGYNPSYLRDRHKTAELEVNWATQRDCTFRGNGFYQKGQHASVLQGI